MKIKLIVTGLIGVAGMLTLCGQDTPKQPWSGYHVHDVKRPHPVKVKAAGGVYTAAPSDAIILFNGKDTAAFTHPWKIADGAMIASPGDTTTKESFGSCQLHIEWRVPADRVVKSQLGGNSGIFFMGLYEVQVQESHTNVTYADGQAAALYGQTPPMVNASTPKGEWQSYDIIFHAPKYGEKGLEEPARVTVIHNGIVVHNHQEFYGPTVFRRLPAYPAQHPEKAPLKIQYHGDPVEYRNIWIRPLPQTKAK